VALAAGRVDEAIEHLAQAYADLAAVGDRYDAARALGLQGYAHGQAGDLSLAERLLRRAQEDFEATGSVVRGIADDARGWKCLWARLG
jgi:hypothetical protein